MKKDRRKIPPELSLPRDVAYLMKWIRFTNEFRLIERRVWYSGSKHRERNGEHCFQIALVAWFFREHFAPHLALTKLLMYALVHDLVEVYAGDTPAFPNTRVRKKYLKLSDKEERELRARKRIEVEFPHIVSWIERYDSKVDEESMLVYSLEKLVTEINIYLDNGRSDKAQEVTLERKIAHLRPRISFHPLVLAHFDALMKYIKEYRTDTCYTAPT